VYTLPCPTISISFIVIGTEVLFKAHKSMFSQKNINNHKSMADYTYSILQYIKVKISVYKNK